MSKVSCVWTLTALLGLSAVVVGQTEPGKGDKPFLGVGVEAAKDSGEGVVVRAVKAESPAATAGLKDGDVIFKLDGKDVPDVPEFLRAVGKHKPGDKLNVQIQRDGVDKMIAVTLGSAGSGAVSPVPPGVMAFPAKALPTTPVFLGVKADELTPEMRKQLQIKSDGGVLVAEVMAKSPAEKAGIKPNDVILAVDGKAIGEPADLRDAIKKAAGKEITLRVQRGKETMDVHASLRASLDTSELVIGGSAGRRPFDIDAIFDQAAKIRDLEQRIQMLEKRLQTLEKK